MERRPAPDTDSAARGRARPHHRGPGRALPPPS